MNTPKDNSLPAIRLRFGQALKAAREQRGLSRAELARQTGLNPAQLRRIEEGRGRLHFDDFFNLAAILRLDPEQVIRDISKPPKSP